MRAARHEPVSVARTWELARSGDLRGATDAARRVLWQGIYGVCLIQAPKPKDELDVVERTALECECNGCLPSQ